MIKREFKELKAALDLFFKNVKREISPVSFETISEALSKYLKREEKP